MVERSLDCWASARKKDYVDLMAFIAADWKVGKTGLGNGCACCTRFSLVLGSDLVGDKGYRKVYFFGVQRVEVINLRADNNGCPGPYKRISIQSFLCKYILCIR